MKLTIGTNLRNARENANYRQVEVKEKTNINNKSLSNWEKDVALPSLEDVIILADLYGVTIDELVGHKAKINKNISSEENSLILNFRRLNEKGKSDLLSIIESFSFNPIYTEKEKTISA